MINAGLILLFVLFSLCSQAQKVYVTEWKSEATHKVYVTEWKSEANVLAYITQWKSEAKPRTGIWYYTEWKPT